MLRISASRTAGLRRSGGGELVVGRRGGEAGRSIVSRVRSSSWPAALMIRRTPRPPDLNSGTGSPLMASTTAVIEASVSAAAAEASPGQPAAQRGDQLVPGSSGRQKAAELRQPAQLIRAPGDEQIGDAGAETQRGRPHLAQVPGGEAGGSRPDEGEVGESTQGRGQVRLFVRDAQQRRQLCRGAPAARRGGGLTDLQLRPVQQGAGGRRRRGLRQPFGELVGVPRRRFDRHVPPNRNQGGELLPAQAAKAAGQGGERGRLHRANLRDPRVMTTDLEVGFAGLPEVLAIEAAQVNGLRFLRSKV